MIKIPNYTIKKILGQGGMSTVYLAEQKLLGRDIALKVMLPELAVDKKYRKTFLSEGKIIAQLEHPNIVRVHDVGMVNDTILFMAMEQLEAGTLKEKLIVAPLDYDDSFKILEEIASGLTYAHNQGYIHRDVKPGNILFHNDGRAIITDFGIAKLQNTTTDLTLMGCTIGTARYMSPEQALGTDMDQRSDVFSLGLVFYEMLTGKKIYKADSTLQVIQQHSAIIIPKLPEKYFFLQKPMNKVLARDHDKRYKTVQEFVDAVKEAANTDKTVVHKVPFQLSEPSFRQSLFRKLQFIGGVTAIALLTGLAYTLSHPTETTVVHTKVITTDETKKAEPTQTMIATKVEQVEATKVDADVVEQNTKTETTKKTLPSGELTQYAGVRISNYGIKPFPTESKLEEFANNMTSSLEGKTPTVLLIVGGVQQENKVCHLSFPLDKKIKNVTFETEDKYASYLDHFDKTGVKVFLQVESGDADMPTLIKTVLNRYQHHPSVVGFGVDVEWYQPNNKTEGRSVTNSDAKNWEEIVKSYNKDYRLFLKYWEKDGMPPNYRGDIIFVDDSQDFLNFEDFKEQTAEWIAAFPKSTVFFQYGYKADKPWWGKLDNPPIDIANAISAIDSKAGVFWVDFTINELKEKYKW